VFVITIWSICKTRSHKIVGQVEYVRLLQKPDLYFYAIEKVGIALFSHKVQFLSRGLSLIVNNAQDLSGDISFSVSRVIRWLQDAHS
jgi:hypothetical protein